jgi:hypothetical protein
VHRGKSKGQQTLVPWGLSRLWTAALGGSGLWQSLIIVGQVAKWCWRGSGAGNRALRRLAY